DDGHAECLHPRRNPVPADEAAHARAGCRRRGTIRGQGRRGRQPMSTDIAASARAATPSAGRGRVFTLWSRLCGLLLDAVLLVFFLIAATAVLDVLVRLIVLIVGYSTAWRIDPRDYKYYGFDPSRHLDDWWRLGLTVGSAVVLSAIFYGSLRLRRYLMSRFIDA